MPRIQRKPRDTPRSAAAAVDTALLQHLTCFREVPAASLAAEAKDENLPQPPLNQVMGSLCWDP